MNKRLRKNRAAILLSSQSGQAMTEYILIVVLVSLVLLPFARLVPEAIQGYVRPFYYCVSRPFP